MVEEVEAVSEGEPAPEKYRIEIPQQGVDLWYSKADLIEFFNRESEFWNRHAPLLGQGFLQQNHNIGDILNRGREWTSRVLDGLHKGDFEGFALYQQTARDYEVVVGQGRFGRAIEEMVSKDRGEQAKTLFVLLSPDHPNTNYTKAVAPLRALFLCSPGSFLGFDLALTQGSVEMATRAEKTASEAKLRHDKFIKEQTALVDDLVRLYRDVLTLREPAKIWADEGEKHTGRWKFALGAFVALACLPIFWFLLWRSDIVDFVVKLTTTSKDGISVAGIAAISVPALFYAWLLKNVSRVFQQSMTLADDSNHRRALALTYLGLAENPKLGVKETDRALILNALFRGTPNVTTDDGPPAGLLDLISSKAKPGS